MAHGLHKTQRAKLSMQELNVSHEPEQSGCVNGCAMPLASAKSAAGAPGYQRTQLIAALRLPIASHADIVVARQEGRALAKSMTFSATDSAFIATTLSELARALLSRTVFGEICLHKVYDGERAGMLIVMRIPIPYDTFGGERHAVAARLALPDVRRLVDEFDVVADGTDGTTFRATKWCRRR